MTHGDNAHDDLEYVEEHVFEIKNDAPKTYNQRHAKVINLLHTEAYPGFFSSGEKNTILNFIMDICPMARHASNCISVYIVDKFNQILCLFNKIISNMLQIFKMYI